MASSLRVLHEDNHLIAVYKKAGVLVQGDKPGDGSNDDSLLEQVRAYIKEKYKKPGNAFVGLIHRLDRNVSGIVLFAKTSKGASRLSEQFRDHTVQKIYHAWVEGAVQGGVGAKRKLENYLMKDENKNKSDVFDYAVPGALLADLSYEVVRVENDASGAGSVSLLRVTLGTGRHHQIRAQLAHIGHPILGDSKYGAKTVYPDQHIALCATELHFDLATALPLAKPERKVITIPVPEKA